MNMKFKILPVPTEVKGLKVVNQRFPKAWETVERFDRARKNKSCIEALALSVNILKYYLTLIIEMYLKQRGVQMGKVVKILKEKKDVIELVNYAQQVKIFTNEESQIIKRYWKSRTETLHSFINGVVVYDDVCLEIEDHFEICTLVFKKGFDIKVDEKTAIGGGHRNKITLSPKTINEV